MAPQLCVRHSELERNTVPCLQLPQAFYKHTQKHNFTSFNLHIIALGQSGNVVVQMIIEDEEEGDDEESFIRV